MSIKSLQLHTVNNLINWNNSLEKARWQIISRSIKMFLSLESVISHLEIHCKEMIHQVESDVHSSVQGSIICNSKVTGRTK